MDAIEVLPRIEDGARWLRALRHRAAGVRRLAAVVALSAAATVGLAGAASAHTSPDPRVQLAAQPLSQASPRTGAVSPASDLSSAITVTNQYWTNHFYELFGAQYSPPKIYTGAARIFGMYTAGVDQQTCGGEPLHADNALYCNDGDWLGVSDGILNESRQLGDAFTYMVVAHEWGHAVQARLPQYTAPWKELQADCFSGATLAGAARDGVITWEPGDSQELYDGLVSIADATAWTSTASHGDAQQRIDFFNHGFANGAQACLYNGSPVQ